MWKGGISSLLLATSALAAVAAVALICFLPRKSMLCPEVISLAASHSLHWKNWVFLARELVDVDACHMFSDTYTEARSRFRQAGERAGAKLSQLQVVGGHDSSYTMDIAVLPGVGEAGRNLVIHTSGVHGIEGYAGSAIQISFLNALAGKTKELQQQQLRPTLIFVHAFNPYGMAHYRRVNENNVDLNRNGLHDFSSVLKQYYNRHNYDTFSELLNPTLHKKRYNNHLWWLFFFHWIRLVPAIIIHGIPTLKAAMVGGQYHNPQGIFYGGSQTQASYKVLESWLKDFLAVHLQHDHDTDNNKSSEPSSHSSSPIVVTWIDVHTGLGKSGEDTMLPQSRHLPVEVVAQELEKWFPNSHRPFSSSSLTPLSSSSSSSSFNNVGSKVAQGYSNKMQGSVGDYFAPLFPPSSTLFVAQEFGTRPLLLVGNALIVENAAAMMKTTNKDSDVDEHDSLLAIQWARRTLRPAFYPDLPQWRASIVSRGVMVLLQGIQRSSS